MRSSFRNQRRGSRRLRKPSPDAWILILEDDLAVIERAAPSDAQLRIRLFGEPDVMLGGERVPPLESARARSLLVYLVLHAGAPQSRQRLAYLLWPDSNDGQARTNLRHLVHTLRSAAPALAPHFDVTPQTLCWRTADMWTDVAAFDAALVGAQEAQPASPDELGALRAAIAQYGGDLFEGAYDGWVLDERAKLRDRYVWALRRLTGLVAGEEELSEAVRLGRELLRVDPLREDSYRLLMRIYRSAGDRATRWVVKVIAPASAMPKRCLPRPIMCSPKGFRSIAAAAIRWNAAA